MLLDPDNGAANKLLCQSAIDFRLLGVEHIIQIRGQVFE
jgi:hypothetical protein